jgi:hypothetical protein
MAVAGTWVVGGLAPGPLHLGWMFTPDRQLRRPIVTPLVTGVGAFGTFYCAALVARRVPVLDRAITRVLRYAHQGSTPLVSTTALANGVAEEVFFRGAVYAAVGVDRPVLTSAAVYGLATTATRNPAPGARLSGHGGALRGAATAHRRDPGSDPDARHLVRADAALPAAAVRRPTGIGNQRPQRPGRRP